VILNRDPGFINYVLREHHPTIRNLRFISRGARLFGNGLVFQTAIIAPATAAYPTRIPYQNATRIVWIIIRTIESALTSFPRVGTSTFIR